MKKIQILDGETINKIAAGEVVERPASVVKELVENAIDAGASAITVEIQDGGTTLIRITDNGSGIEKEDIPMAFLRHSTSKIRTADDLLSIGSLGFRGEALSSISAVAQVELLTKTSHAMTGCRYRIEGGIEKAMEDIGCPDGTTFIIRQLFYNTPARRKFLKSNMTEAGYIQDLMQRMAMSHPEISFKFINNRQNRLNTSGNGKLKDIIYHIYGRDVSVNILPVDAKAKGIHMTGFIGKPMICRGNRTYENYFVNGRYVKSPVITQAIEDAYKTFTMVHKFPFAVLHFELDAGELDVNVHPTKMEVRIHHAQELYQFIFEHLKSTLYRREFIPEVEVNDPVRIEKNLNKAQVAPTIQKKPEPEKNGQKAIKKEIKSERLPEPFEQKRRLEYFEKTQLPEFIKSNTKSVEEKNNVSVSENKVTYASVPEKTVAKVQENLQYELFETGLLKKESRIKHQLIGQIFETYWIVEFDGKLFIIDQHAAHEKVLYEKLMRRFKENKPMVQFVHPPLILTLSMTEIDLLQKHMDDFKTMGFEFESFGGKEYALRGVPSDLYGLTGKEMVIELLDELSGESSRLRADAVADRIATMACKAAVKGNMRISSKEADALIEELLQAENPYTCPHGRPTIISMTKTELEKKFKRIV
ncbi:MAG: DNA mismatch repair endonuclease MutL [Lachnospiraceae bacterium]|nr:DNA mismatch repair endonuclease MutL [Lachnospiraceae bacterium]